MVLLLRRKQIALIIVDNHLKVAFHKNYCHPLPEGHRFPMLKYEIIPEQLLYEGTLNSTHFHQPKKIEIGDILATHTLEYWEKLRDLKLSRAEERKTGFPLTAALVEREITIAQGTIDLALHVINGGKVGLNIAGGTHHAYADRGEGFCLLNDIAIASNYLLNNNFAQKILVVDLDVHQGNGTAKLFEDNASVFTFSMHGKDNYPLHKEQSDLDIPLLSGTTDKVYLEILENTLPRLLQDQEPDIVFFQAGVDVLSTDKLGKLGLSRDGCKARDRMVFDLCAKDGVPIVVTMGGGYSEKITDIVEAHCNTFRLAAEIFT